MHGVAHPVFGTAFSCTGFNTTRELSASALVVEASAGSVPIRQRICFQISMARPCWKVTQVVSHRWLEYSANSARSRHHSGKLLRQELLDEHIELSLCRFSPMIFRVISMVVNHTHEKDTSLVVSTLSRLAW